MRVIVCGSRDWNDSKLVYQELDRIYGGEAEWGRAHELVIVHGACKHWHKYAKRWIGADQFADDWCVKRGVKQEKHPADWEQHQYAAGPIRNEHMASLGADLVLAFWDGASKGTLNMIVSAIKHGIRVLVIPRGK